MAKMHMTEEKLAAKQQKYKEAAARKAAKKAAQIAAQKAAQKEAEKADQMRRQELAKKAQAAMRERKRAQAAARQQKRRDARAEAKKKKELMDSLKREAAEAAKTAASTVQRSALKALEKKLCDQHEKHVQKLFAQFEKKYNKQKKKSEQELEDKEILVSTLHSLRQKVRTLKVQLAAANCDVYRVPGHTQPISPTRRRRPESFLNPDLNSRRPRVIEHLRPRYSPPPEPYPGHLSPQRHPSPRRAPVSRRLTYGESPPYRHRHLNHYHVSPYSHRRRWLGSYKRVSDMLGCQLFVPNERGLHLQPATKIL